MKALAVFALAAVLLCGRVDVARSAVGFTYSYPCKDELRFDTSGLECRRCDHNEVVLGQDECGCVDGTARTFEAGGVFSSFPCKECPNGTVPSSLGPYCVHCDGSSGPYWLPARIDSTGCSCEQSSSTNAIATELGLSGAPIWQDGVWLKRCVVCPEGTVADAALQKCRHCPWPQVLDGEGECICPTDAAAAACDTAEDLQRVAEELGVSLVGAYEIKAFDVMSASQVGQELTIRNSKPFVELLPAAAIGCHDHGNRTACNSLANLCVLAGYDSSTAACQLYERLRRSRELEQYHAAEVTDPSQGWALTLPWLTYTEQDPELVLEADDVRLKLTFGDEEWRSGRDGEFSKVNNITLLLSETTLQGEWLGLKELTTELQVCGVRLEEGDHWRQVGFAYLNDCELSVQQLLRLSDLQGGRPRFFDVFLKDGTDRLYPVPIIDTSLRQRGRRVNQDAGRPDELVRRLVFLDAASLQEEGGQLQAVSYPQQLRLTVQMHDEGGGRIHPPALTVEYRAVSLEMPATAQVHKARFEVAYKNSSKTRNDFWEAWEIMLGVFVGLLGGVYAVGRVITKCVLVPPVVADAPNGQLNRLLDLVADIAAAVSFWLTAVLLCLSFYSLSFFKLESEVHTLLPENDDLEDFRATAIAAVVLASMAVAYTIYKQVNLAVLFVDWAHAPGLIGREGSDLKEAPVSCWRLLFVANELNELQTVRLTSPALTLMFVLFVLSGLGLEDEAMMSRGDWEYSKHPHGRKSILLAFGINTSFYLLGVLIQILYRYAIGHRFVSHPLEEYVNLLYLANVSCLIYDSQEWSGFYLHGRNQMDCVDTSLSVLNQKLLQEGRGLVAERGLQSTAAIKDLRMNQRFLFHQAGEADLRRPLSELCAHAARKFEQESSQKTRLWAGFHGPDNNAGDAELLRSLEEKQHQVKRAIELIQQQPSRVREPQPLQALLGLPSREEVGTRDTVLVHDFHNRWARTMWYGQEPLLVLFELLFFCCVDMDLSNTALSATLTFFATSFVSWLRRHYGEKNLARKTMIDQHFLI